LQMVQQNSWAQYNTIYNFLLINTLVSSSCLMLLHLAL